MYQKTFTRVPNLGDSVIVCFTDMTLAQLPGSLTWESLPEDVRGAITTALQGNGHPMKATIVGDIYGNYSVIPGKIIGDQGFAAEYLNASVTVQVANLGKPGSVDLDILLSELRNDMRLLRGFGVKRPMDFGPRWDLSGSIPTDFGRKNRFPDFAQYTGPYPGQSRFQREAAEAMKSLKSEDFDSLLADLMIIMQGDNAKCLCGNPFCGVNDAIARKLREKADRAPFTHAEGEQLLREISVMFSVQDTMFLTELKAALREQEDRHILAEAMLASEMVKQMKMISDSSASNRLSQVIIWGTVWAWGPFWLIWSGLKWLYVNALVPFGDWLHYDVPKWWSDNVWMPFLFWGEKQLNNALLFTLSTIFPDDDFEQCAYCPAKKGCSIVRGNRFGLWLRWLFSWTKHVKTFFTATLPGWGKFIRAKVAQMAWWNKSKDDNAQK